jgi:hypothetical protein
MKTSAERPISDYLEVARQFRRSANLEKDYRSSSQNGEYILTPTALESLHRLTEGLSAGSASRAWTITGPYGVGKSSFAVFLTRVFCSRDTSGARARELIRHKDPELAVALTDFRLGLKGKKGFLPILVTARRTSAPLCIAEGIAAALAAEPSKGLKILGHKFKASVSAGANGNSLDTKRVVSALESVTVAARNEGYRGVLLIIDELGKLFEYAARYPQRGDVYVLQEIGEYFARSRGFPTIVVGLLHQSFEEYGHLLDIGTRREWSKIQGRFADIPFLEPADQVIRMVAEAIHRRESAPPRELRISVERVVIAATKSGAVPPGMPIEEFKKAAMAAYPLHPLALVAIPYIFRRFGQNERSLFSYLSSGEPFGFQEFVKTRPMCAQTPHFVRLADLFDYFSNNFGLGLYRQPQAIRWLEAADVLERKDELGKTHQEVVKTIGVLNALGLFSHLSASAGMISCAVQDTVTPAKSFQQVLKDLEDASVLTHRSYNNSYRIWEGSDVDLEERVAEGKRRTGQRGGLADGVRQYIASRPVVARRHSFATGALRVFDVVYVDSVITLEEALNTKTTTDGKIVVCLSESGSLAEGFQKRAKELNAVKDLLIAIPQQIGGLRGVVTELAALRWVWENTPELRDDRVARREVSLRITEAEQLLLRDLNGLVDPRPEPIGSGCLWFHAGSEQKVATRADVSQLLSDVFDRVFQKSPKIRNELIVRRTLSSAGAAARRNLIEAMLHCGTKSILGIEGYPPERSIYESVLRLTGLHGENKDGSWRFSPPSRSPAHNLLPCWNFLNDFVFKRQPEPIPLNDLFRELSAPPWGVLDGLHPVLLCAFMMVYPNETTLYREQAFVAEPGIADFELILRRPELFSIAGCRVTGSRASVVKRISEGLRVEAATVPVVRALFRIAKALPEFAWNTRLLPAATLALREAFNSARSPERFLFVEVPTALGLAPFSTTLPKAHEIEGFFQALNQALQEWSAALPRAVDNAREMLLDACGVPPGDHGWEVLRQQAVRLENTVTEPQLLAFIRRVIQASASRSGVESVCALIASRPPGSWTDLDVERFPDAVRSLGNLFRDALRSFNGSALSQTSLKELDPIGRRRAEGVIKELRIHLEKLANTESAAIIKTALYELLREIDEETQERGELNVKRG